MPTTNEGISLKHEGTFTLAKLGTMINASVLQGQTQPTAVLECFLLESMQPAIHAVVSSMGKSLGEEWSDISVVCARREDFFRRLKALGIAERVPGDIGRPAKLQGHRYLTGEIDYRPGVWIHRDLALPYAWRIAAMQTPPRKTPLVTFLEKHLGVKAVSSPADKPSPVACVFADEVDDQGMKDLEAIDKLLMADGVSSADRAEVLRARVDAMQGA